MARYTARRNRKTRWVEVRRAGDGKVVDRHEHLAYGECAASELSQAEFVQEAFQSVFPGAEAFDAERYLKLPSPQFRGLRI